MKIGILTLHEADSYGAVLQAYALQQTLKKLGSDSEFLSFFGTKVKPAEKDTSSLLLRRIHFAGEQRSSHFAAFRKDCLICAPMCPPAQAGELNHIYDCFISGSDQVWNPQIPGVDGRYFLPFVQPEKRYSYAASFGTAELPEQVRRWCGRQLAGFRGLSVREESGRRLIRELTGREAAVCLDPTMLLTREEWDGLTHAVEGPPYVLLFLLKNDAELTEAAKETAGRRNLALRVVTGAFLPQFGFDAWSGTGVEQWVSLIRHAECVFTNSFHGAVFSMIFGRLLRVAGLTGQLSGRNGRMEELLQNAGMEAAFESLCPPVYPELSAGRIGELREASVSYLKGIISNEIVYRTV